MIIRKFDEFGLPNKSVKRAISPEVLKEREEKKKRVAAEKHQKAAEKLAEKLAKKLERTADLKAKKEAQKLANKSKSPTNSIKKAVKSSAPRTKIDNKNKKPIVPKPTPIVPKPTPIIPKPASISVSKKKSTINKKQEVIKKLISKKSLSQGLKKNQGLRKLVEKPIKNLLMK